MPDQLRRLAVICEKAPIPHETFIRRDIEALKAIAQVKVFGISKQSPSLKNFSKLSRFSIQNALRLSLRMRTINAIAEYVGNDGIIVANFAWITADMAAAAAAISNAKWFCSVHAWDVFTRPAREIQSRLSTATAIIACSHTAANAVINAGVPLDKVHVIHHGIDFESLRSATSGVTKSSEFSIAAVGRLVPKKGFDQLIYAWSEIKKKIPMARLKIIGDGSDCKKLHDMANALSVESLEFLGHQNEKETLREIARANILILPSRRMPNGDRDGIANVILEAMALGTPVITTDAGAAGEIIRNNSTGLILHAPVIPHDLTDAVVKLYTNPKLVDIITKSARTAVCENFNIKNTSAELQNIIF